MMRVSPILLLLAVGLSASGQTITDINVRGQAATKPPVRIVGGSGTGPGDQTTLVAELTVDDPSGLVPGKPFDFELLVTNHGKRSVVLPQSLNWEDVDSGGSEWRYVSASVTVQVAPDEGRQRGSVDIGLELYGSREKPSTELALKPGDSVRILGSSRLPLNMNINGNPIGKGKIAVSFSVNSVWLRPAPTTNAPDGYRAESRTVFIAESETRYPVNFRSKQ